jgi:hypothetical protein
MFDMAFIGIAAYCILKIPEDITHMRKIVVVSLP